MSQLTDCFARRVAAWFAEDGRRQVADPVRLRQMNMAVALAASRWNEFATEADAASQMRAWLDEVERRALARKAHARAEAIDRARRWFEECAAQASSRGCAVKES